MSGELGGLFLPMLAFSTTTISEAEYSMVNDMLLMNVVLERLQHVVGFLGADNWHCGGPVQTGGVK